jgi:hypothetical protein
MSEQVISPGVRSTKPYEIIKNSEYMHTYTPRRQFIKIPQVKMGIQETIQKKPSNDSKHSEQVWKVNCQK